MERKANDAMVSFRFLFTCVAVFESQLVLLEYDTTNKNKTNSTAFLTSSIVDKSVHQ